MCWRVRSCSFVCYFTDKLILWICLTFDSFLISILSTFFSFLGWPAERACSYDYDCPADKACVSNTCQDPCSLRGACGENAICRVVLHKARCSCPQCFVGKATTQCLPDPRCSPSTTPKPNTTPRPTSPPSTSQPAICTRDNDCHAGQACNAVGSCQNPCDFKNIACEQGKRCEARRHRPVCVCKHGFVINDVGELVCGPTPIECRVDDDCASNLACTSGRCQNPCAVRNPCLTSNKTCQVLDHKPICICAADCEASVSICLRDRGCPPNLACINFQCANPCQNFTCNDNRPCYVEEHKAVCKFCPPGFTVDPQYGCIKGIFVTSNGRNSYSAFCHSITFNSIMRQVTSDYQIAFHDFHNIRCC